MLCQIPEEQEYKVELSVPFFCSTQYNNGIEKKVVDHIWSCLRVDKIKGLNHINWNQSVVCDWQMSKQMIKQMLWKNISTKAHALSFISSTSFYQSMPRGTTKTYMPLVSLPSRFSNIVDSQFKWINWAITLIRFTLKTSDAYACVCINIDVCTRK